MRDVVKVFAVLVLALSVVPARAVTDKDRADCEQMTKPSLKISACTRILSGANLPNARTISNVLSDQTDPANPSEDINTVNQKLLSDYIYVFGQFLDHDLDLTPTTSGQAFNIPPGSATDPMGTEAFTRSVTDPAFTLVPLPRDVTTNSPPK